MKQIKFVSFSFLVLIIAITSCSDVPDNDLFPAKFGEGATPVITAINPADSSLAGVGTIEIMGENFSPILDENFVYFDAIRAELLEASATRILLQSPNLAKDSIQVKVANLNADDFSEVQLYRLKPAVQTIGNILTGANADEVHGLAVDNQENVFVYIGRIGAANAKLKKITPQGATETLSETLQFDRPNSIKMGPDNLIYLAIAAGRVNGIYTLDQAGISTQFASTSTKPQDLDFDQNGNIWVAAQQNIIRISADASKKDIIETVEVNNLTALRVYDGYLYYGGNDLNSDVQKIWKSEIQGDILGARDTVLNIANTTFPQGAKISGITFSAAGKMYIAFSKPELNLQDAIYTYDEASGEDILYGGLISSDVESIIWGNGSAMYVARQFFLSVDGDLKIHSQVLKVDLGEEGAPNYGKN